MKKSPTFDINTLDHLLGNKVRVNRLVTVASVDTWTRSHYPFNLVDPTIVDLC